jgi:hypothetical protein
MNEIPNTNTEARVSRTYRLWERPPAPSPIVLQPRDERILELVFRHRFLRPAHLHALLIDEFPGSSAQRIGRRCQLLWVNRYLERPQAQRPLRLLSDQIVYALGKKGAQHLESKNPELRIGALDWTESSARHVGSPYMDHDLAVADFMVVLQLACNRRRFRLHWDGHYHRRRYRLHTPGEERALNPDAYFVLENERGGELAHHFLEVERARKRRHHTVSKCRRYFEWWKQGGGLRAFKNKQFRVLLIAQDGPYMNSLRRAVVPIGQDRSHPSTWKGFMFSHLQAFSLAEPERILGPIFRYAGEETPVSLV